MQTPYLFFLNGKGSVTAYWYKKYHVLTGCYRFALARGMVTAIPLPRSVPKQDGPIFVPYIYSHAELKRLIDVLPALCAGRSRIDDYVFKALLLLMYGAGLRISEALSLHIHDVDLQQTILYVRETKFYKTRIVPLGKDLTQILNEYIAKRNNRYSAATDAPFFCFRDGTPLSRSAAHGLFRRVRAKADVLKEGGPRHQPRLHDLRHSAAVHRLIAWYRCGADLRDLLPKLATYLGHVDLSATQRYLTMTPELLHEASLRFAHYALEKDHD
ncbi:tyrosine-type recombinase/integrase [Acidithiobacillus ferrooxidans]|uniref:tyrosine-type recombinase/integrase n=1 Tax=Acidithiobacillus ferrooxidans TaxID=920 RepID=UPI0027E12A32|nr:tyrosine-type recombinase/integrase [Acidithiobacillus ferrooxidans]